MILATPVASRWILTKAFYYSRLAARRLRRRHLHCAAAPCRSNEEPKLASLCSASKGHEVSAEPSSIRRALQTKETTVRNEKLAKLRELFKSYNIHAYIVPSEDAHQSEFLAECFNRRAYISEFTGSAGTAVITLDKAALWTDGRYFLQAEQQLGPEWKVMRGGTLGVPSYGEWLRDNLPPGSSVGIDPFVFTSEGAEDLARTIRQKDVKIAYVHDNLVDKIWGDSRPPPPVAPVRVHPIEYAGIDVSTKIEALRKEIHAAGASSIVITTLDEVAWLFNIRGGDVPRCPVAYAYAIVDMDSANLFIDLSKVTPEVRDHLEKASVSLKPYGSLLAELERLAMSSGKLWLDPAKANMAIVTAFSVACEKYYAVNKKRKDNEQQADGPAALFRPSPLALAKAIKNKAEMKGVKQAHLRDAAALAEFWAWLEEKIVTEKVKLSEVEVADRLLEFRSKQDGFVDTSFDTICGAGPNGAIIHYSAEPGSCAMVDDTNLMLLDSGAQFVDGTTDITRTVHFGEPTEYQKECFTRVLKGHIALDQAVFPENTPGFVLDAFARSSLWKIGLDYRHGTGHGVGAALNVHEGPHSISFRFENMTTLRPGMIVSNEPGYYEDHNFGIRIENLLHVCERDTPNRFGGVTFLGFEQLSYVPIQTKLIATELMNDEEISWLNHYHAEVWNKVSPLIKGNALKWLRENTTPITKS